MPDKGKSCYKGTDHTTVFSHDTIVILDLLSQLLQTTVELKDKLGEAINLLRKKLEAECNWSGGNENVSTSRSMHPLYQLLIYNWEPGKKLEEMIELLQKWNAGHHQTDGNENASTSGREGANLEQSLTGMPSNYNPESITLIPEYAPQVPCLENSQGTEEGEQNTSGVTHMLEDSEKCCLEIYLAQANKELIQMEEDASTPEPEDGMVG
jgi:hypothetical protein